MAQKPIKVMIKQLRPLGRDWVKYTEVDRILITGNPPITSEARLCYYIYKKFGVGRYQLLAWQKGHEGFWMFWLGDITDNGFLRDRGKNKELDRLKKEHDKARSYDEKSDIEEEIQFEKEISTEEKKLKRRGPYIITKSPVGQLNPYEEF